MNNSFFNFFKNKKVLITGHTGFKGAWLCIILRHLNSKVYGISLNVQRGSLFEKAEIKKKIFKHQIVDIRDKKKLRKIFIKFKPEIVIHFAAQSLVLDGYKFPEKTFETNFNGTLNLLECFTNSASTKKILITTTDKVYDNTQNKIFDEKDKLWGSDPYSASKVTAEQVIDTYRLINLSKNSKKVILVARSGNIIGGGDISKNRIVPDIIKAIKSKKVLKVRNPDSIRPWQHVLDPLIGYLKLIYKQNNYKVNNNWNFGPTKKNFKKVKNIIKIFKKKFNLKYQIIKINEKEIQTLRLNSNKSRKFLPWKTQLNFEQAINLVISYENEIKKNISSYNVCLKQFKKYFKI